MEEFTKIYFDKLNVNFKRTKTNEIFINLSGQDIEMIEFEAFQDKMEIIESCVIGSLKNEIISQYEMD